jgi:selenoprotein W-related protein
VRDDLVDEVGPDHQHEARVLRGEGAPHARAAGLTLDGVPRPRLEITYCTQCRWLLRAGWTAQELLTTFPADLGELALVPGTGGVFTLRLDDDVLWDREEQGGFPELPRLKQTRPSGAAQARNRRMPRELPRLAAAVVRDRVAPDRSLGHSDRRAD